MQIAFVIQHFQPYLGGAERQAAILAELLAQRGHQVQVITTRYRKDLPRSSIEGSLRVRRLPTASTRWLKLPANLVTGFIAGLSLPGHVEIIHTHCLSPFSLGAAIAAKLRRRPVLVKICAMGTLGDIAKVKAHGMGRLLWRLFLGVDQFVAPTRIVADELIAEGVNHSQVAVISNLLSVDLSQNIVSERPQNRRKIGLAERLTVLFVGRLSPEKGLSLLMQVWPAIASAFDIQLVIVGEGIQRAEIERWRDQYRLSDSVVLMGYQVDPAPYYQAADIFVFPSHSETFGNVIVEAMSHGLAVISTAVGVVSDWPEDAPVTRFDRESPDQLTSGLDALIRDQDLRNRLGNDARTYISDRYQTHVICEHYGRLYGALAGADRFGG